MTRKETLIILVPDMEMYFRPVQRYRNSTFWWGLSQINYFTLNKLVGKGLDVCRPPRGTVT